MKPCREETEQTLSRIWSELLQVEQVGREDNFFELGGHSLLAVQLVGRIHQRLGYEITLRDLFAYPTMASMARVLKQQERLQHAASCYPLDADRSQRLELSWSQQRLWFIDQLEDANEAYQQGASVETARRPGPRVAAPFIRCVDRATRELAHRVRKGHKRVRQEIHSALDFALQEEDLHGSRKARARARRSKHAPGQKQQSGSILRTGRSRESRLLQLSGREHDVLLVTTMHRVISDGWSIGCSIRRVRATLRGMPDEHGMFARALPIQVRGLRSMATRQWLRGERLQKQVRILAGASGRRRRAAGTADRSTAAFYTESPWRIDSVILDRALSEALNGLAQRHQMTLFMLLSRRMGAPAIETERAAGCHRRHTRCQPTASRGRGTHRMLHEYRGASSARARRAVD